MNKKKKSRFSVELIFHLYCRFFLQSCIIIWMRLVAEASLFVCILKPEAKSAGRRPQPVTQSLAHAIQDGKVHEGREIDAHQLDR